MLKPEQATFTPTPGTFVLPDIFERIPLDLFAPLGSPYARVYWAILARFYGHKFEGSPVELPKGIAVDMAEEVLSASVEWRDRRADFMNSLADVADPEGDRQVISEMAILRATSRRLVMRLKDAGWYYFEFYREAGEVLNFYPYAARLLGQMMAVARDEQPVLRGYAHAVASMLRPDDFARSPGVAVGAVRRQTLEFAREIRILHGNIRESINRLFDEEITAAEILHETLDRYRDRVRRNYHLLKTRDNIFGWRIEILGRLDAIERQVAHIDEAVRWYAEQGGVSAERARELVLEDLQMIRGHIEAMPRVMREIDERNQRFSGVAARRVAYLMRHDARMEGQLQFLVDGLGAGRIPPLELHVYRAEFLGPDFLYTPKRRRPRVSNPKLRPRPEVDSSAADIAFARRILSPYRPEVIRRFVRAVLDGRSRMGMSELPLQTDEDYLRALHVVQHGGGAAREVGYRFIALHCGSRECANPWCEGCRVRSGEYSVPNGRIERLTGGAL